MSEGTERDRGKRIETVEDLWGLVDRATEALVPWASLCVRDLGLYIEVPVQQ